MSIADLFFMVCFNEVCDKNLMSILCDTDAWTILRTVTAKLIL
jgi:hypothetical protein